MTRQDYGECANPLYAAPERVRQQLTGGDQMSEQQPESGYSMLFYVMLLMGIVGVLGMFVLGAGVAVGG